MEKTGKDDSGPICLWCGKSTEGEKSVEHVFPKSIGGKETLPLGSVHKKCSDDLDSDRFLKKGHLAMMDAFQVDSQISGYRRKGKNKERKQKERIAIKGIGEAEHTKINRKNHDVYLINPNFIVTSKEFVRALHKCLANVLCYNYGSKTTRENYKELLKFVKDGGDVRPWSYAISYPNPVLPHRPLISEPKTLVFLINGEITNVICFIHTSGIWLVGSHPFSLNPKVIEDVSELIMQALKHIKEPNTQKPITDFFGFNYESNTIGKLKFLWIVKEP
jgi:hypothetical protein